jgi:hypothetical protein
MADGLPPELDFFLSILDAQPAHVRDCFNYCLCLLMVEAGKMHLVEKVPGEPVLADGPGNGMVCVFATTSGDHFSVVEPKMSKESKAALIDVLREILEDEGYSNAVYLLELLMPAAATYNLCGERGSQSESYYRLI